MEELLTINHFFPNRSAVEGFSLHPGVQGGSMNRNYNVPPSPSPHASVGNPKIQIRAPASFRVTDAFLSSGANSWCSPGFASATAGASPSFRVTDAFLSSSANS